MGLYGSPSQRPRFGGLERISELDGRIDGPQVTVGVRPAVVVTVVDEVVQEVADQTGVTQGHVLRNGVTHDDPLWQRDLIGP